MSIIFFYKCIIIKVTERIVNPIMVFAANFKVSKNVSSLSRKKVTGDRINMQELY